ncbi:MAG: ankyrin repeat domain-containing protein [Chlamydiales bacterium]|nr:ankyrin repeat domain-containing protein [Chlamydiales bacterium]
MGLVTSTINIDPEARLSIPQTIASATASIGARCQRLKICLFYCVDKNGRSSTISLSSFQPVIRKIAELPNLVKVVLDFNKRIFCPTDFGYNYGGDSEYKEWRERNECLLGHSEAEPDMINLITQFFGACKNVKSLSLKSFVLNHDLCKPLCNLIRDSSKLASLKISHSCHEEYHKPETHIVNNSRQTTFKEPESKRLKQEQQSIILCARQIFQALASNKSMELYGFFCLDPKTETLSETTKQLIEGSKSNFHCVSCNGPKTATPHDEALRTLRGYMGGRAFEKFSFSCHSPDTITSPEITRCVSTRGKSSSTINSLKFYCLDYLLGSSDPSKCPLISLIGSHSSLRHLYLDARHCYENYSDGWIEGFEKALESNTTLLDYQPRYFKPDTSQNPFESAKDRLLGESLLIPEKYRSFRANVMYNSYDTGYYYCAWNCREIGQTVLDYRTRLKELFYLIEFTNKKGPGLNQIDEMIRKGMSVNAWDKNFRTPLHIAVSGGNVFMVEYLRRRGAEITPDIHMQTPIGLAYGQQNEKELLKALGAEKQVSLMKVSHEAVGDPQTLANLQKLISDLTAQNAFLKQELEQAKASALEESHHAFELRTQLNIEQAKTNTSELQKNSLAQEVKHLREELDLLRGLSLSQLNVKD